MKWFLYLCRCEAVWICYDIAITESQANILVYLSLLVSNDNANDSVVGKSLGIVWGKIQFYKLIEFSAKPQNETNRNQRNNKKQGKCENVVFLNFCFCVVSRQDRMLLSILIFRWLQNSKIDLRSSSIVKTKAYKNAFYHMYVCPTSAHRGFRYGYRRYKGNTFTLKTTLFGWQSTILRLELTLLNIMSAMQSSS